MRSKWSGAIVARAKGMLFHGFPAKLVSKILGVPVPTVRDWASEKKQAGVSADLSVLERVSDCVRRSE